jgi:putative sigma-54 modulation protein
MRSRYRATTKPGRPHGRLSRGKTKRSPLADSLPRGRKRTAGRTEAAEIPAFIRAEGVPLGDDERAYTRRKLGMKLGKFAPAIERVSVRIADVNGPRGGVDQVCRIKVVLSGLPRVVVENRDASPTAAIDAAITGVESAVRRTLRRRRMKPRKQRA